MTDEEIHKLALEIRQALIPPRCVSTEIPRVIQEEIKRSCYGRPFQYNIVVPMGANGIIVDIKIQNSGEIALDLQMLNGDRFWRVYLGNEDITLRRDNMDIEERAEKWVNDWINDPLNDCPSRSDREDLIAAYLAGAAQTQKDYTA